MTTPVSQVIEQFANVYNPIKPVCDFTVAHVYEEAAQKWWRFDDETVTVMPSGPIGEKADNGVAAAPLPSSKKVLSLTIRHNLLSKGG